MPELKWRLTSSFPKSLDTIYGAAEAFAKAVAEATDNRFQIQVFAAGEIVPGLQAADAVQNGTVEMCHTASYYYFGKDPTFALGTAVPFGLNSRMQTAWMYFGGGMDLMNDFYKKFNIYGIPAGNTGAQMGGWFRKEIKEVCRPQRAQDADRRICRPRPVQARRRAAADRRRRHLSGAGERHDRCLRVGRPLRRREARLLRRWRQFYYYPGWWEGGPMIHNFINIDKWNTLPPAYKSLVRTASSMANEWMQARYDAHNPAALKRLVAAGAQLRPFSQPVMDASLQAPRSSSMPRFGKTNADFKKVLDAMLAFRNDEYLWWQVAELTYDSYLVRNRTRT